MAFQKTKPHRKLTRLLIAVSLCFFLLAAVLICGGALVYRTALRNVDISLFENGNVAHSPRFFLYHFEDRAKRQGVREEILEDFYAQRKNAYLPIEEIPEVLIDAFVSIEDKEFFSHNGINWRRTLAAGANYLFGFRDSFGGSTITQQLVKNMTGNDALTVKRKLFEIVYATELEKHLDKSEIMELYLNVIHFSDRCDGVSAAAEHYFSKSVQELTVAECATIAAITNSPTYYNPIKHPENNLRRRNLILSEMYRDGVLSEEAYVAAASAPLGLCVDSSVGQEGINSWYADMVIDDVIGDLAQKYNLSRSAATHLFYTKGLSVDVAMDPAIQSEIEEYYRTAVRMPQSNGESAQSALIVMDPHTGDILGVVGAVGEKRGNHLQNYATMTRRAPGSTIKPLSVYAPALEEGLITYGSVFDDVPVDFQREGHLMWPQNATRVYRGLTDVAYAVAHSTNTVAVRVLRLLDRETAFRYASEKFHLGGLQRGERNDLGDAALALGQLQKGVTLRELTAAYTVFADRGVYHPARSYYRVTDSEGTVLLANADRAETVLSEENAAIMTKLLEGVVRDGTAGRISLQKTVACAGKTGTSGNDHDRWFVGYTPEMLCGVWCGYSYPKPLQERYLATTQWNHVMKQIYAARGGQKSFDLPPTLICVDYCMDSGLLPCDACTKDPRGDRIRSGWFVRGSEPKTHCQTHILCPYDTENDGVIHGEWSDRSSSLTALVQVERHFPISVTVTDAQYVYFGDPSGIPPNPHRDQAYFAEVRGNHCGSSGVDLPYNRSALPPPTDEDTEKEPIPVPWKSLVGA